MSAPKLRFKEFDGSWDNSLLINLAKEKSLNNGVFNDQNKVGQGYKLINVLDMYIERDIDESRLSLLDLDLKEFERNKVKFGDIFFTRSSLVKEGIAFSNVYLGHSQDITYDGHLIKLSPDLEKINPILLNYSLKTSKVRKQLIQGGKTATMTTIGQQEVGKTTVDLPEIQEQTKIASFLSAVDGKISQLNQKHELLSQYKQGMMQKLFSQQIRFKADDGGEFGAWEEKLMKDIADVKGGKRIPKGYSLVNTNTGHPYITVSDMNRFYSIDDKNIRYVPIEVVEAIKRYTITDKDIFISVAGTLGIIGKIPTKFNGSNLTENADKITNLKCNQDFLIYLLDSGCLSQLIESNATTSAQPKLALYAIEQLEIQIPSIEEQTKIANFLSAIDQKIDVVAQQIQQAKLWKKGLLQQMFV